MALAALGNGAAVTQLVGNAGGHISKIIKGAKTARQNKVDCEHLAGRVSTVRGVLSRLPPDPQLVQVLAELNKILKEAHSLVVACQKPSTFVNQLPFKEKHRAEKFSEVNARMDSDINVLMVSLISYIAHDERRPYAGGLISSFSCQSYDPSESSNALRPSLG
jgi:hypothetical protein